MPALIIIGCIILLFIGIGAIRATVHIDYKDDFALAVSVLGIKFKILPKKEKKVNIKKYSAKRFRKMLEKDERNKRKKLEKKLKKSKEKEDKRAKKKLEKAEKKKYEREHPEEVREKKEKRPLGEIISLVREALSTLLARFGRHFRIKVARLNITVATGDAATTAMLYGVAAQGVSYILEALDRMTNVDYTKNSEVNVNVDYLSESTTVDISLAFSLRVWHIFDMLLRVLFSAIKNLFKSKK